MEFGFLGLSFKNANLDIRDKTAFTDSLKIDFFQECEKIGVTQCMVLSTCNRSEIYYFFEHEYQIAQVKKIYKKMFKKIELDQYLISFEGYKAYEYLFKVSSGLESQVIGEDQILGQVKEALDFSRTMGFSKKELNRVVRDAVTCAKSVKTKLKISEIPLSVSYVGIRQLEEMTGIAGKKVLVIGSGKTSALALRYVYDYGAKEVWLSSRTYSNAKELQKEFSNLNIIEYDKRYSILSECHIVISATASPHTVIKNEFVNVNSDIYMLDLATPRDIDIELRNNKFVHLINLDSLHQIVLENQKERENLTSKGLVIIKQALKETIEWLLSSRMDETIESLQQRCNHIVEDSYEYLSQKIELSERERILLKRTITASLKRLLKDPIKEMKQLDTMEEQDKYKEVVSKLFQL